MEEHEDPHGEILVKYDDVDNADELASFAEQLTLYGTGQATITRGFI